MNGAGARHLNWLAGMGSWVVASSFANSETVEVACRTLGMTCCMDEEGMMVDGRVDKTLPPKSRCTEVEPGEGGKNLGVEEPQTRHPGSYNPADMGAG